MICNRCGSDYARLHTCQHPQHVALDEDCVYHDPGNLAITTLACDICGPIRAILAEDSL